jgi:hypothetical protein
MRFLLMVYFYAFVCIASDDHVPGGLYRNNSLSLSAKLLASPLRSSLPQSISQESILAKLILHNSDARKKTNKKEHDCVLDMFPEKLQDVELRIRNVNGGKFTLTQHAKSSIVNFLYENFNNDNDSVIFLKKFAKEHALYKSSVDKVMHQFIHVSDETKSLVSEFDYEQAIQNWKVLEKYSTSIDENTNNSKD